jgi:hypothetical protein
MEGDRDAHHTTADHDDRSVVGQIRVAQLVRHLARISPKKSPRVGIARRPGKVVGPVVHDRRDT